jgi:polar amino acid transport system substrate-binding protein
MTFTEPRAARRGAVTTACLGAVVALVAVTGCGGGSSDGGAASGKSGTLEKVKSSGTMRVGTITGNAPFESLDKSGNLVGYDIDIINEVARRLKVKVNFFRTDVAGRVTVLQAGKADAVVGSFTDSPERERVVSFTKPINLEYVTLMVSSKRGELANVKDLNTSSSRIAVASGSTQATDVPKALPKAKLVVLPGIADELQAVSSGQADAAAVANTQVGVLAKQSGGELKVLKGAINAPQNDAIGVPKGDDAWLQRLNQIVDQLNADGTNYRLTKKWFKTQPPPFAKPPA